MSIDIEEAVELFEIRTRGAVAAAFSHAGIGPNKRDWEALRGERDFTMRDISEIGFMTDVQFNLSFHERPARDEDAE